MSLSSFIAIFIQHYDSLNVSETFQLLLGILFLLIFWRCILIFIEEVKCNGGIHYVEDQRPPLHAESLDCPFTFSANIDSASYSGIHCTVKSREPCFVQAMWGVPLDSLIQLMDSDTKFLRRAITTFDRTEMFGMNCIDIHVPQLIPANEEANLEYKPRDHTETTLAQLDSTECRFLVPFVIVIVLESDTAASDTSVVAMANVIHLPNAHNRRPSCLKYQIIKLASGILGNVEKIYHASSLNDDNSCVICYTRAASIVFIPCRHCCLCNICYQSLSDFQSGYHKRCPVCRQIPARLFQLPSVVLDNSENMHLD